MPEYRRFIAYFYEYINGKKQKNAGFAKVELRNGMWRILFRLTTDVQPEPPLQVFGFVREKGYLLGFSLGTMPNACEIAEEWAYQADSPVGFEKYRLEDLSGIWIRSGEGRCFITVWDDDPVDVTRFVLEMPKEQNHEGTAVVAEEDPNHEERGTAAVMKEDLNHERATVDSEEQLREIQEVDSGGAVINVQEMNENNSASGVQKEKIIAAENRKRPDCLEELFQKRQHFSPFSDQEIMDCVQILPCDVMRLQQEKYLIGRSSFLQHGYYQHRHLLLGKRKDGSCILGVPGIRSQQEQYMAKMFGYDQFKMSRVCDCGRVFGYWYRII